MANSKIPVATTIQLLSLNGEEFYAVIVPENIVKRKTNNIWIFRKGCGTALFYSGKLAENDDPTMTVDGIRTQDIMGKFDEIKEMLCEEK